MRMILAVVALLLAAGCGSPTVTGNAQGGVMPWHGTNTSKSFNAAQAHCQKYGRDARITQIVPHAGGSVAFDCVSG